MGYYTTYSGEITIDPPLNWSEFKNLPGIWDESCLDKNVKLHVEEELVDTDDGVLTTRQGLAIVPVWEDAFKGYYFAEHLQQIVTHFSNHEFSGQILGKGEEAGDIRRYLVKDGKVLEQQATFAFPDNQ